MAITQNYVDFGSGNDTTGDGSVGTPWKTLQKAVDTVTRNTTDGNQINVKAGTAQVLAAAINLTTFVGGGALSNTAPLVIRGYTIAADDGGVGEIDCAGFIAFAAAYDYLILVDLELHTFGNANGVVMGSNCRLFRCEIHKGASSPTNRTLLVLVSSCLVVGCYIHDAGAGTARCVDASAGAGIILVGNYIVIGGTASGASYGIVSGGNANIRKNIVVTANVGATGIYANAATVPVDVSGNIVRNTTAGTASGIIGANSVPNCVVTNNIVTGWSGAGGEAVNLVNAGVVGFNAFYNNTANYSISDQLFIDLTANDVALGADPFTDAANGDFSLTEAGKTALRSLGWPASYLGAHANSDPHITIGAMQYGPAVTAGGMGGIFGSIVK